MSVREIAVTKPVPKAKKGGLLREEARDGFIFIAPWFLGFILWTAGPMIFSLVMTFTHWSVLSAPKLAGLDNFRRLIHDDLFYIAMYNTAYYTLIAVPLQQIASLAIAFGLNLKLKAINVFRTVYYMPTIVPQVASVMLWMWIFNPEFGLANYLLGGLGLPEVAWLWDPRWAKPSLIIMALWGFGTGMIIYLAGLQGVPTELYEAAQLDGANAFQRMIRITIPMITPVIFFNTVMGIIGSFQIFTTAYLVSGGTGAPANSTLFLVLYLYRKGFRFFEMGYAATIAWALFILVLIMTAIQFKLSRRWVYYEEEIL